MSSSTSTTVDAGTDAENLSWVVLLVVLLVLSLTSVIVGMRIYTRIFLVKQLGWDDYCVVVTLFIAIADGGSILGAIPNGLGRHTSTVDPSLIPNYLLSFWLSIVFYNLSLTFIKLTFLFQYWRVLSVHKMKRVIWTLGTIIMMWAVSQLLVVIFSCTPVDKFWHTSVEGTCIPNLPFWYINAAGNIATDLAIFIMPLPVLSKLQLRKKQKYLLMGIFSLGFFTCAISLIRLAYLKQGPDFTFDNVPTSCWSTGEISCGIICACLPTLRPLLAKVKPAWITSTRRTRNRYGYGGSASAGGKGGGGAHSLHYGSSGAGGVPFGNAVDIKGAATSNSGGTVTSTSRSRSTRDSILLTSTSGGGMMGKNNHYSRIRDADGASVVDLGVGGGGGDEQQPPPMPPSPAYRMPLGRRRSDGNMMMLESEDEMHIINGGEAGERGVTDRDRDVESGYGEEGREGAYPMRALQPRARQQQQVQVHDKAMEVLGMGRAGTGVSTEVTGGSRLSMVGNAAHQGGGSGARSKTAQGIEVKRVVVVTTSDAEDERSHAR